MLVLFREDVHEPGCIADRFGALQTFAKNDLPKEHRVLKEGDMATMDHKPDR